MSDQNINTGVRTYSEKIALLPKMQFKHVLGGFKEELESEYFQSYFWNSLGLVRIALVLSALLVASFGILDIWIVPISQVPVWIIRFACIIPILAICFILSFMAIFRKIMQGLLCFMVLTAGLGFVVMTGFIQQTEMGFYLYYVGIIQVLIAAYTLFRIRFKYAAIAGLIILGAYEFVSIFYNNVLATPEQIPIFLNNNFFLISTNIMGMIAGYFTEFYLRNTFLLRKRIQLEEEQVVENTRHELLKTKKELNQTQTTLESVEEQTDVGLWSIFNSIQNKHAIQKDLNKNAARSLLMLRNASRDLNTRVNKALNKSFINVLDRQQKILLEKLDKESADKLRADIENNKKKIIAAFSKQNMESIENYINNKIQQFSEESIGTLDDSFKNMTSLINYIYAIIAYQRGEKINIEEHVVAALRRVFFTLKHTYKKELGENKIEFEYINNTESSIILPIYDFILEEDIMRNLFLNSFRSLIQSDPENKRSDKKMWIEIFEENKGSAGKFFIIHFKDNGLGVPSDKKEAIFHGFSTKPETEPEEGTGGNKDRGVGCLLVRSRIEKMGGTIVEMGEYGAGADFVISIPKPHKSTVTDTSFELAGRTLHSSESQDESIEL